MDASGLIGKRQTIRALQALAAGASGRGHRVHVSVCVWHRLRVGHGWLGVKRFDLMPNQVRYSTILRPSRPFTANQKVRMDLNVCLLSCTDTTPIALVCSD